MADDFTLKWDAQNQELYGEDPSTGDRIPVPFDSVNTDDLVINQSTSGAGIKTFESGSFSAGTGLTFDTGIQASYRGELVFVNFKEIASGSVDQYFWMYLNNISRDGVLIKSIDRGAGSSNVDLGLTGDDTYRVDFDASDDVSYVSGTVIGSNL